MRRLGSILSLPIFSLTILLSTAACGPTQGPYGKPVHNAERATAASPEVSDDAFAGAVRDLLASEPQSKERQVRLRGIVARQMSRVATRFKDKDRDRAVVSFAGAMYLVRAGELTNEMLGPRGYDALKLASDEFAKRGDEGRARASYEMLSRVAPAGEKSDIKGHLDAISAWTRDTAGTGPVQTAGGLESAAVTRHLLEPSKEARDEAIARTIDFIEKAVAVKNARRARGAQVTREEGLEVVRALETGATVLAAIYLRDADPAGGLRALEKGSVRELTRPELVQAIQAVVDHPEADKWMDLARMLRPSSRGREEDDFGRDTELLRVAAFTCAAEAYRLDSTLPETSAIVSSMLVELGMGEAAPAVLSDAVKAQKDPRIVGLALAITMQAMGRALDAEDPDAVRRTFRAAQTILASADGAKAKVEPPSSRVYAMMGEIEIREGNLDRARAHLTAAADREKNGSVQLSLARLDWHAQKAKNAQDRLTQALTMQDVTKDPGLRGEVLLLASDIAREQGDVAAARKPLSDALRDLTKARGSAEGDDRARIERLIARVLDRFGASASALKALERALEAAPRDKRQTGATVGQLVGRAFVKNDLKGAREALLRAISADLGREDLVYYAVWVRLLELSTKVPSDGMAERVLREASDDPRWIGRVAAFGAGKIKAAELVSLARTPTQKTESAFYAAMEKRLGGDAKGAEELLKQVTVSSGIDLMEVAIAREILSGPRAQIGGPVPEVGLP